MSEIEAGIERLEALEKQADAVDRERPLGPGALTPRQRLAALVDQDSALEIARHAHSQQPGLEESTPADGLHTALARVSGYEVIALVEDPVVLARSDGEVARSKRNRALGLAAMLDRPVVLVIDGAPERGVFPPEQGELAGRSSDPRQELDPAAHLGLRVGVVCGPAVGLAREWLGLCDWVVATRAASAGLDPGIVDRVVEDDAGALDCARALLAALLDPAPGEPYPRGTQDREQSGDADAAAADLLLARVLDAPPIPLLGGEGGIEIELARIAGWSLVLVRSRAGGPTVLTRPDLLRLERGLRLAARADLPLLLVQDFAGLAPGAEADAGLLARVAAAHRGAGVPRLLLVTGAGHVLGASPLGSRSLGADVILAWPSARVALTDPPSHRPGTLEGVRADDPWLAAGRGLLDDVITPAETRMVLHRYLALFGGRVRSTPRSGHRPHDR